MKRERYTGTLLIMIATILTLTGCNHAKQGEVLIETKWNRPIAVHRANDASTFQTWYAPGADYDAGASMTVLEFVGIAFIVFVIWLTGYIPGYHVGYGDSEKGKPRDWSKTRKPPGVTERERGD